MLPAPLDAGRTREAEYKLAKEVETEEASGETQGCGSMVPLVWPRRQTYMASVTGIVADIHSQVTDVPNSSSAVSLVIVKSSPSSELALYSTVDLLLTNPSIVLTPLFGTVASLSTGVTPYSGLFVFSLHCGFGASAQLTTSPWKGDSAHCILLPQERPPLRHVQTERRFGFRVAQGSAVPSDRTSCFSLPSHVGVQVHDPIHPWCPQFRLNIRRVRFEIFFDIQGSLVDSRRTSPPTTAHVSHTFAIWVRSDGIPGGAPGGRNWPHSAARADWTANHEEN